MFSRSPVVPFGREQIPGFIDSMAEEFPKMAKVHPIPEHASLPGLAGMLEVAGSTKGKITGDAVSGEFVLFTMQAGMNQAMFVFSDGDEVWQGQFAGSPEQWTEALQILQTLQKKG